MSPSICHQIHNNYFKKNDQKCSQKIKFSRKLVDQLNFLKNSKKRGFYIVFRNQIIRVGIRICKSNYRIIENFELVNCELDDT